MPAFGFSMSWGEILAGRSLCWRCAALVVVRYAGVMLHRRHSHCGCVVDLRFAVCGIRVVGGEKRTKHFTTHRMTSGFLPSNLPSLI